MPVMTADDNIVIRGLLSKVGKAVAVVCAQRWQSTTIENRTHKKADQYVMNTKQELLSSCQHQIEAKDQDLRRVLNIFAFHVLNEVRAFLKNRCKPLSNPLLDDARKKALESR